MYTNNWKKPKEPEINTLKTCPMDPWKHEIAKKQHVQQHVSSSSATEAARAAITEQYNQIQTYNYMEYVRKLQELDGTSGDMIAGYKIFAALPKIEGLPPGRPEAKTAMTYGERCRSMGLEISDPRGTRPETTRKADDGWGETSTKPAKSDGWSDEEGSTKTSYSRDSNRGREGRGGYGGDRRGGRGGARSYEPRDTDWACPKCSANNFSHRRECFKCHEPKADGGSSESSSGGYRGRGGGRGGYRGSRGDSRPPRSGGYEAKQASSGWSDDEGDKKASTSNKRKVDDGWGDEPSPKKPAISVGADDDWDVPVPVVKKPVDDDDWGKPATPKVVTKPAEEDWDAKPAAPSSAVEDEPGAPLGAKATKINNSNPKSTTKSSSTEKSEAKTINSIWDDDDGFKAKPNKVEANGDDDDWGLSTQKTSVKPEKKPAVHDDEDW